MLLGRGASSVVDVGEKNYIVLGGRMVLPRSSTDTGDHRSGQRFCLFVEGWRYYFYLLRGSKVDHAVGESS